MELKPTEIDEFRTKQYWEQFFKKRGHEAFEWYGDYGELCDIIHKYAKPQDNILVVGCGNSQLSADMYDVGYHSLTNIDLSDTVIRQMSDKYRDREKMKFIKMDLMEMSFEDGDFTVVLDKGTLDAIMTDDSDDCHNDVNRMFSEISRVLKFSGRYVCVTLAQEHILHKLVQHFSSIGWPVRVHKVETSRDSERDRDFYMPLFVVVATKFKTLPDANFKILELSKEDGSLMRVDSEDKIYSEVKNHQLFGLVRQRIVKRSIEEDQVCLRLMAPGSDSPRYTLHVVDSSAKHKLRYACFIVPQGRENEWLFCTDEGRTQLAQSAEAQRLAVVSLHREHDYTDLQSIQDELSAKVLELAPPGLGQSRVPFLSVGDDIGLRHVKSRGTSQLYGDWVVEDVTINGKVFRRLVYLNQPDYIQTEVKLVPSMRKKKGSKRPVPGKLVLELSSLCSQRHVAMVAGLAFLHDFQKILESGCDTLVFGDPGCVLSSYLRKTHQQMKIDVVQSDAELIKTAHEQFGLVEEKLLKSHVGQPNDVIVNMAEKGIKKHVIVCDMTSPEPEVKGLMAPPAALLAEEFLTKVNSVLHPEGVFVLHFRHARLTEEILKPLKQVFQVVLSKQLLDDISVVVYCIPSQRHPELPHADRQKLGVTLRRSAELVTSLTSHVTADVPSLVHMLENLHVH